MNRAEPPDQIYGVNADNGTIGEQLGKNAKRDAVLGIVERRHEHGGIRNVEVRITGGKSHALEKHWGGHGEVDHLHSPPIFQVHSLQPLAILRERFVVHVPGIVLPA